MKRTALIIISVVLILVICGCDSMSAAVFNSKKTDKEYSVNCIRFSGTDRHALSLEAGDVLTVTVTSDSGSLGVTVADGDNYLYRSDAIEAGSFTVTASAAGKYTVILTGNRFSGKIAFQKNVAD